VNPKQKRNAIILGVLGVVVLVLVYRAVFGETEQDRIYRENQAKSAAQAASGQPATPDAAPAAVGAAAAPVAARSQFQRASVDVDQLIASIQEIGFNYDTERPPADPMTPLVGPTAPSALATTGGSGDASAPGTAPMTAFAGGGDAQAVLRTFRVTGIVWDKHDPMAVVTYPVKGSLATEVITRGFKFPDLGIVVNDIESERVVLNANGTLVSLQLEER